MKGILARTRLGELLVMRDWLARVQESIAENTRLRPELEQRVDRLSATVVELAERRTRSAR